MIIRAIVPLRAVCVGRSAGIGTSRISGWRLRKWREALHATVEAGSGQYGGAVAALQHTLSVSPIGQIGAIQHVGDKTKSAAG